MWHFWTCLLWNVLQKITQTKKDSRQRSSCVPYFNFRPGFHSPFLSSHTRRDVYHLVMLCFVGLLGPFTFFDVSKTKLLQLVTSLIRWVSFLSMIILAIMRISSGHSIKPESANIHAVPNLFGAAVYSFMCQHRNWSKND